MRNKFILFLICLLGPFTDTAWADDPDASPVAVTAANQTPVPIPARGTLYRVRYHDHTAYLFGAIHIGRAEFFPLEEQATRAFAEADTLMLEVDMRDQASLQSAVKKYGVYADNDTLDKHLSPASLTRLKQALALNDLSFDQVAHMKAWMVANLLLVTMLERQGYHTQQGTETFLLNSAEAQGKPIQGLESADFQLSLFDTMKEKQQEQYLTESLADLQSGVTLKKTQELIDAWAGANEKAFDGLMRETQNDNSTGGKFFRRILLNKRNPAMATGIETLLQQDRVSFVAVGLLHLIGVDGVPRLLSRRGYEVTRLY